mmetsp:Transcript_45563/g.81993  ORF Transcript_45563/g.81993 Transcript_45563/m.81993 type:complete len:104 (+) Transcript_45563:175-486(+)
MQCATLLRVAPSLDERVGKEQHQRNDETVDGQGLHECQGEEEHSAEIISHFWLTRDAIDAAAGGNALADTRANSGQANGKACTDCGEGRDPNSIAIGSLGSGW